MPIPTIKNLPDARVHITVTDAKTRKSKGFTLYGVTPTQAISSIKRGLDLLAKQDADQKNKEADAA